MKSIDGMSLINITFFQQLKKPFFIVIMLRLELFGKIQGGHY